MGDILSSEAKGNLIRSILPGLIEQDYSGRQALQFFREQGLGIRTQDFYSIHREVLGTEIASQRIQNVRIDFTPSDSVFDELKHDSPYKYRLIGRGEITDPISGNREDMFFGWDTDSISSISNIQDEGIELFSNRYPQAGEQVTNFRIYKGFINPKFK